MDDLTGNHNQSYSSVWLLVNMTTAHANMTAVHYRGLPKRLKLIKTSERRSPISLVLLITLDDRRSQWIRIITEDHRSPT